MARPVVILIHGLWMTGREMFLLQRRLEQAGFRVERYRYAMINTGLADNVERLRSHLDKLVADTAPPSSLHLHLLGHSLGGVLALHLLRRYPDLPVNKVICLGSPLADSSAARRTMELTFGKQLVGKTLKDSVISEPVGAWEGVQPVGVIAGSRPMGLTHRITRISKPHDGIVTVAETRIPGLADHLVLPVSHTGLVFSKSVAAHCATFLREGRFGL